MKGSWFLATIFLVSLTLRVLAITTPINSDEVLWMSRGGAFINHLLEGDLTDTYSRHHPGVTNMWLIGSSMVFNCLFPSLVGLAQFPLKICLSAEQFPISLYVIPRFVQAIITSACMVYLFVLTKQLLGQAVALCSISILLLEPFFLAYQRYLTTDALVADFGVLALLLLLLYLRDTHRRLLVTSGVFMGLATATKIIALYVLPAIFIWIALIERGFWRNFPQRGWKQQMRDLSLWGATILAVFFLIWPAMWVSPGYVFTNIYNGLVDETARGRLFFLGQITDSPNLLFYPLALAYRLSPVLQLGLLACLAILMIPKLRRRSEKIPELAALALTALCVLLLLSASSNKIDRYITLCIPLLALLAGVGWLEIVAGLEHWGKAFWQRLHGSRTAKWRINSVTTAIALAALQLVILIPYYPYYITYYNPLLGGSGVAQRIFMVGQGEGLDLAAQWLNQLPNVKEVKAASWSGSAFDAYFQGQAISIRKYVEPDPQPWTSAHRVVLYYNQFQRQLPEPKMIAYFAAQQPLHTVRLHGIDYARIYPGLVALPEDLKSIQVPLSLSFGEQVRLLGYDLNTSRLSSSQELVVTFYWKFIAPLLPDATLSMGLLDNNSNLWNRSDVRLLDGYLSPDKITPGTVLRDVHKLTIAPNTPLNRYRLQVGWLSSNQEHQAAIGEVEVN